MSGVEIKMLHAGAITQVVRAVVPEFEKRDRPQGDAAP